jgi:hypothetical protein
MSCPEIALQKINDKTVKLCQEQEDFTQKILRNVY